MKMNHLFTIGRLMGINLKPLLVKEIEPVLFTLNAQKVMNPSFIPIITRNERMLEDGILSTLPFDVEDKDRKFVYAGIMVESFKISLNKHIFDIYAVPHINQNSLWIPDILLVPSKYPFARDKEIEFLSEKLHKVTNRLHRNLKNEQTGVEYDIQL